MKTNLIKGIFISVIVCAISFAVNKILNKQIL